MDGAFVPLKLFVPLKRFQTGLILPPLTDGKVNKDYRYNAGVQILSLLVRGHFSQRFFFFQLSSISQQDAKESMTRQEKCGLFKKDSVGPLGQPIP